MEGHVAGRPLGVLPCHHGWCGVELEREALDLQLLTISSGAGGDLMGMA